MRALSPDGPVHAAGRCRPSGLAGRGGSRAADPCGSTRIAPGSRFRGRGSVSEAPVLPTPSRRPFALARPARVPDGFPRFASSGDGGSPADPLFRPRRPNGAPRSARPSVGWRHCNHLARLAFRHAGRSRILRAAGAHRPGDADHGADGREPSGIASARPGHLARPRPAAGRAPRRNKARPGREASPVPEALRRRRGSPKRRPDAFASAVRRIRASRARISGGRSRRPRPGSRR